MFHRGAMDLDYNSAPSSGQLAALYTMRYMLLLSLDHIPESEMR